MWSIGVIAFMLLSGTPPFYGRTDADTLNAVKLGRWHFDDYLFKPVSAEAKDFITKCLTRRPATRPTAKASLEHKWFNLLKEQQREEDGPPVPLQIIQRLDNFIKRTKLAKIIMDVVAHTLIPEQIADLRIQFTKFDRTESGDISLADMRSILIQFPGFKEEDLNQFFTSLDIDQTGKISYHEFLAATISRHSIKEENLQIAFERMSDRAPYITSGDIKALLGNTNYDVDKIMEEVGLTTESKINFQQVSESAAASFSVWFVKFPIGNTLISFYLYLCFLFLQFKIIMNGGTLCSGLLDSPCRNEMRKAVFWKGMAFCMSICNILKSVIFVHYLQ